MSKSEGFVVRHRKRTAKATGFPGLGVRASRRVDRDNDQENASPRSSSLRNRAVIVTLCTAPSKAHGQNKEVSRPWGARPMPSWSRFRRHERLLAFVEMAKSSRESNTAHTSALAIELQYSERYRFRRRVAAIRWADSSGRLGAAVDANSLAGL